MKTPSTTLGVILGNRDFFPDVLITEARRDLTKLFAELDIEPVWLAAGRVESGRCGNLGRCAKVR